MHWHSLSLYCDWKIFAHTMSWQSSHFIRPTQQGCCAEAFLLMYDRFRILEEPVGLLKRRACPVQRFIDFVLMYDSFHILQELRRPDCPAIDRFFSFNILQEPSGLLRRRAYPAIYRFLLIHDRFHILRVQVWLLRGCVCQEIHWVLMIHDLVSQSSYTIQFDRWEEAVAQIYRFSLTHGWKF